MTSPQQRRAIRTVVILLVASVAAGVLVTAAGVAAHVVALGPNQILVLLVATGYVWVIRRLLAGAAGAYRRVRIVSVAGFLLVAGQLAVGGHPAWLRAAEAAQLALLAALIVAVNRRVVREAFPPVPDHRPRNRRAALVLAVLAPLCAEVSLGSVPLRTAWAWLVLAPIYSAGALFLREILRRTGGGYGNLLLLGVAYGLVEEGLVLQSLTSPHLYGVAGWGPRLLGVNTAYAELNLVYHALFSVTIPVILVEFLFARHGRAPYLRRGGVVAAGVLTLLSGALLRVSVPPSEDPGYTMPPVAFVVVTLLATAVVVLAVRVRLRPARRWAAPAAPAVAVTAAVAAFGFLALLWPLGDATRSLSMTGAALVAAAALGAAWNVAWTPRHLVAAAFGALTGHTLFGLVSNAETLADRLFLTVVAVLTAASGVLAHITGGRHDDERRRLERDGREEVAGAARRLQPLSAPRGAAGRRHPAEGQGRSEPVAGAPGGRPAGETEG
jgi:hypothetical protein